MELMRTKGVATVIAFPIVDADGDIVTAATTPDSELLGFADATAVTSDSATSDCTNEAVEMLASGIYTLILTSDETNFDYVYIQIKTATAGAKTQHILINTLHAPLAATVAAGATAAALDAVDNFVDTEVATIITDIAAVKADTAAILVDTGTTLDVRIPAALVSGRMDASVGAMAADTITATAIAAAAIAADAFTTDALSTDTLTVGLITQIQAGLATAAALAVVDDFVDTEVAAIITTLGAAGAGLTAVPWNAAWDAEAQSEVADALNAAIADSVPADGSAANIPQALYMILQFLTEKSIAATTLTVAKPDGSTALMTFTLNDGTNPTSVTRAS